ncbi:MAG: hypothetical protein SPF89_05185 [Sphaerochaetaceae bacterium]|nr:hypothetical protein [Spirochaetales bacterium]MDY5499479.1 hypothetical protein [Sphaerochaetaceae bacterium]
MVAPFISFHLVHQQLDEREVQALEGVCAHRHHADACIDDYIERHQLNTGYQVRGTLKEGENLFGITDPALLRHTTAYFSALRAAEILWRKAEPPFGFDTLLDLHGELFGDIDPFAGMLRTYPEGIYCAPGLIESQGEGILFRLQSDGYLDGRLALLPGYLGDLLALHPFARGNRMVIHLLFEQMGRFRHWQVDWGALDLRTMAACEDEAVMGRGRDLSAYLLPAICPKTQSGSTR